MASAQIAPARVARTDIVFLPFSNGIATRTACERFAARGGRLGRGCAGRGWLDCGRIVGAGFNGRRQSLSNCWRLRLADSNQRCNKSHAGRGNRIKAIDRASVVIRVITLKSCAGVRLLVREMTMEKTAVLMILGTARMNVIERSAQESDQEGQR